ncbi:MAG: hypothetical protein K6D56_07215 [Clostridia bacterium]|nr:hypothetical protein [Clostridia bacterium]
MKNSLTGWTIAHFAVDMSCLYIAFRGVGTIYIALDWTIYMHREAVAILLYNILAFGLQSVIGALVDRFPKLQKIVGIEGTDLMLIPLIMIWIWRTEVISWAALIIAGILNACFHVGGGVDVIRNSGGRITPSGIFVSSGALGVVTGTVLGRSGQGALLPILIVCVAIAVLYFTTDNWAKDFVACSREGRKCEITAPLKEYVHFDLLKRNAVPALAVACMFFAVLIRSYGGFIWPFGFDRTGYLILLVPCASCLGKALGGIAADRFGALETAVVSLLISAILFFTGDGSWVIMGISLLLFNMAMPITLAGLVNAMPEDPGFAFGLSTLALLLGYILLYVIDTGNIDLRYLTLILILVAAVLIAAVLRGKSKDTSGGKKNEIDQ